MGAIGVEVLKRKRASLSLKHNLFRSGFGCSRSYQTSLNVQHGVGTLASPATTALLSPLAPREKRYPW